MRPIVPRLRPHPAWLFLVVCLFLSATCHAATANDFKTSEFWNSTGLELLGAADAYALGYTGKGITLGIIDTPVRTTHPELSGKVLGVLLPRGYPLGDWTEDAHGSHVAGIMVAKRNGIGMQGVAFDADLVSVALDLRDNEEDDELPAPDFLRYFAARPGIKVINNSWGTSTFPYEDMDDVATVKKYFLEAGSDTLQLYTLVTRYDKLMVFAAGNDGHASPGGESIAPRYLPSLTGWINVVSVNPTAIHSDADGSKTGDVNSLSLFSNLAAGAQLFSVSAPGTNISSLDAQGDGTGYTLMSGTSMAAPYVTGALGLVQQAFPWMTAKQLADTILTTADNEENGRFRAPDFTVSIEEDQTGDTATNKIVIRYLHKSVPWDPTADLTTYYQANKTLLHSLYHIDSLADFLDAYDGNYALFSASGDIQYLAGEALAASFADVFGQGLANVRLAVGGPGLLDANRLTQNDASATYACALYQVDTKGYTGVWSNDIGQRLWDNALHHPDYQYVPGDDVDDPDKADALALIGQNVGLLKTGAGTLVLTGRNTYQGATVVRGGTLSLRTAGTSTGGRLVNSPVTVEAQGTLTGDGTVAGSLTNEGTVRPGIDLGSALTAGTYTQQGDAARLALRFDAQSRHTSLATSQATFAGGQVQLAAPADYYPSQTMTFAWSDLVGGTTVTGAGFDWSTALVAKLYDAATDTFTDWDSPTLGVTITTTRTAAGAPDTAAITFSRAARAYSRYGANANSRRVGTAFDRGAGDVQGDARTLVQTLDFSAADGSDVRAALPMLSPRQFAATSRASLSGQRAVSQVLLGRLLDAPGSGRSGVASGDVTPSGWHGFLSPLGGLGHKDASDGLAEADRSWGGVLAGLATEPETAAGVWDLGVHAAFVQYGQHAKGAGSNDARTSSFQLGAQLRFAPNALRTDAAEAYTFGLARLGVESTTQHRSVYVDNYARTAKSDWVSPVGSLLAGAGYDWTPTALDGRLRLGPVGWLDYATAWRPDVAEYGGQAINLHLRDAWSQSLRTSLGARLRLDFPFKTRPDAVSLDLRALWNHELLDAYSTFTARFASFGPGFTYRDTITARDSVSLAAGLTGTLANDLSLGLAAGTELGATNRVAWGSVNVGWSF